MSETAKGAVRRYDPPGAEGVAVVAGAAKRAAIRKSTSPIFSTVKKTWKMLLTRKSRKWKRVTNATTATEAAGGDTAGKTPCRYEPKAIALKATGAAKPTTIETRPAISPTDG